MKIKYILISSLLLLTSLIYSQNFSSKIKYSSKSFEDNILTDTTTKWLLQIKGKISTYNDVENYLGVADSATDVFDQDFDYPEAPPPPANFISIFFPHPEWGHPISTEFARDIRKNTSLADTIKRWYFTVKTDIADTVRLNFIIDRIPSNLGKFVTDLTTGIRINLKSNQFYSYVSTGASSRSFLIMIGDSVGPNINIVTPNGSNIFRSGSVRKIIWTMTDVTGVDSVFVFGSNNAGSSYNFLRAVGKYDTTSWLVPQEYLNHNYSVKLIARDSLGNTSSVKSAKTFSVVGDSLLKNSVSGWQLISLPLIPNDSSAAKIFGDDITSSPYYLWDYLQNIGYVNPSNIKFGKGYWLGLLSNANWDVRGNAIEADSTAQNLAVGYNIIGSNFVRNILRASLLFKQGTTIFNFTQAASAGWIGNVIYGYSATGYASVDTLKMFDGYWLSVLQSGVSIIQKPSNSNITPNIPYNISPNNWELPISVSSTILTDNIAVVGVKPDATSDFDPMYDAPRPPRQPGPKFLEISFPHSGGNYPQILGTKYARDFKGAINPSWDFSIETADNTSLKLVWLKSQLTTLGDTIKVTLKDNFNGQTVDMKKDSVYIFNYTGVRNFNISTLRVPPSSVNNGNNNLPTEFAMQQNYPNPWNPVTIINYQIPTKSFVSLKVFDILGREVATLVNEEKEAGYYEVQFNASKISKSVGYTSGVYIYELKAGDFRSVKKMTLIK